MSLYNYFHPVSLSQRHNRVVKANVRPLKQIRQWNKFWKRKRGVKNENIHIVYTHIYICVCVCVWPNLKKTVILRKRSILSYWTCRIEYFLLCILAFVASKSDSWLLSYVRYRDIPSGNAKSKKHWFLIFRLLPLTQLTWSSTFFCCEKFLFYLMFFEIFSNHFVDVTMSATLLKKS